LLLILFLFQVTNLQKLIREKFTPSHESSNGVKHLFHQIKASSIPWKSILALVIMALAIFFIRHEKTEIIEIKKTLLHANAAWVVAGLSVTFIYILLQAGMYYFSFRSIHAPIPYTKSLRLFLGRNLLNVFLPGGGLASMNFFVNELEKHKVNRTQNYLASLIYMLAGFSTVVIIAIPSLLYLFLKHSVKGYEVYAFLGVLVLSALVGYLIWSLLKKKWVYRSLERLSPDYAAVIDDMTSGKFSLKDFRITITLSLIIEITGMIQLWMALASLSVTPTIEIAIIGYVVVVLLLITSPILKGIGPVEFALAFILHQYGIPVLQAVSVTFMFRFLEFWSPLLAGLLSFVVRRESILYRLFPPVFIFLLGIINIVSVLTPPMADRLALLQNYLPEAVITASNYSMILSGLILMLVSVSLFRGLRNAWIIAVALSALSLIGHLTKAIDYEEASLALVTLATLVASRKEYRLKTDPRFRRIGLMTFLFVLAGSLIYGITGFYFLDKRHFDIDFSFADSIRYTLLNFILIRGDLVPLTSFGKAFLVSINSVGAISLSFFIYSLVRPFIHNREAEIKELDEARNLLGMYGRSALDYFKVYNDKFLFFSSDRQGFLSYKAGKGYALVLENPVAANPDGKKKLIGSFEKFCSENNLIPAYYRVPEEDLDLYHSYRKKSILIGQEAVVDLNTFSLEGGEKKPLRNAINKVEKSGYILKVYEPPLKDGLIQKLQLVSDEWLSDGNHEEELFSQGMFLWNEIKQQTVLVAEDAEEKLAGFINIIPDYAPGEGTYDLQRKLTNVPNGIMDFLLIHMFDYFRAKGIRYANLGLVPLSGIDKGKNIAESTIKFMYEQLPRFAHYKGLRDFKDKFDPVWHNKYLIYTNNYDLLRIPGALGKVIKP